MHPGREVIRSAAGDERAVDHNFIIYPLGARVDQVVLDGHKGSGAPAADQW